ncbi:YozE family protein [Lactobacillus delbrueckii subsp. bulgaricus]|nr:hypothetical protein [Lactobacillus delbrueckii subsp. bulgaricus]MBT8915861.1 hypothetical protein [Lactobacillus delbrueckii subsp. bulgaricus]
MTQSTNKYNQLMQHLGENTYLGDLAKDVSRDAAFPRVNDWETVRDYLEAHGAIWDCLQAAESFWKGGL